MAGNVIYLRRKINTAATLYFPLVLPTTTGAPASTFGLRAATGCTFAAGDAKIGIDGAGMVNTTNLPVEISNGFYSWALTAAELNGQIITVALRDQTGTWVWEDLFFIIETALSLGKVDINNPAGDAISAVSSGGNGNGATLTANGSGSGLIGTAGNTAGASGIRAVAGTGASGAALYLKGAGGGTNTQGMLVDAQGSASGIDATGGASNGHGLRVVGQGSGNGLNGVGGASGYNTNAFDDLEGSEPTTAPVANATFRRILQMLKRRFTNKVTQTATTQTQFRDDGVTSAWTAPVSDDGTTQTKGAAS